MSVSARDLLPDRLLEQLESWTIWDRRAWEPGTILSLRELSEALDWVPEGVLSAAAVDWFRKSLQQRIGQDAGLPAGAVRSQLSDLLRKPMQSSSQPRRQFDELVQFISLTYLRNWRDTISSNPTGLHLERASRFISGHVIDSGYNSDWLRGQVKDWITSGADALQIVDNLVGLLNASFRDFEGLVLVLKAPEVQLLNSLDSWIPPERVRKELEDRGFPPPGIKYLGALSFRASALDPISAARSVGARLERMATRAQFVRSGKDFEYHPQFFSKDGRFGLVGRRGAVHVQSMVRTSSLYESVIENRGPTAADDALQLASPLLQANDPAAITSGWASLESLLVRGSDATERSSGRAVAADRAAAIITAGWPRSELTRLGHRALAERAANTGLRTRLTKVRHSNERVAEVTSDWLISGNTILLSEHRDIAAVQRMEELVRAPHATLGRVRSYITASLRRLYRQRNIILHGGEVQPLAMRASLRTTGPLVAAALDRLLYAEELTGASPLNVAARAEVALAATKDQSGWPLHNLTSL